MITLKDYVGNIYREITKARVQADIETVEVAREYANHDLLKHFSVQNMKMKNVEVCIPVAVDSPEVRLPSVNETVVLNSVLDAAKKVVSETEGNKLISRTNLVNLKRMAKANTVLLKSTPSSSKLDLDKTKLNAYINKTADKQFSILKPQLGNTTSVRFRKLMIEKITAELARKNKADLEKIPVIIETSRLRTLKDTSAIMNIKIVIEEDSMEWMRDVDEDGNSSSYLSYE